MLKSMPHFALTTLMAALLVSAPSLAEAAMPAAALNSPSVAGLPAVLQKVMPAVVNISAQGEMEVMPSAEQQPAANDEAAQPPQAGDEMPRPQQREFESLGSGVIVDAAHGFVLTNAHVISQAKTITVTLSDGRKLPAKLMGSDPSSDIAVIQIKADGLSQLAFADSDALKVGEPVAAIGNPFGLSQTVTSGIISGLQRSNLNIEGFENFIQTDASINPGNSGGALVNMQGSLIGINTAILAPSGGNIGIGFAIPANMAHSVMIQLIQYGAVKRGLMGILVNDLTPELAKAFHVKQAQGAVVAMVTPNSPAAKAGIRSGDIILQINQQTMRSASDVRNIVGLLRVGAKLNLTMLRQGKPVTVSLVTEDPAQYQKQTEADNPYLFGVNMREVDELTPMQGRIKGIMLLQIKHNSPTWRAGLRPGDVILSANQVPVTTIEQLLAAAKQDKQQLLLNVFRRGAAIFVVVK